MLRWIINCRCPAGRQGRQKVGFTYIEMMVTVVIITLCFVPLVKMFTSSVSQISYSGDRLTALNLAREEMEKIKNLNLTESQIAALGSLTIPPEKSPPIFRNKANWRIKRILKKDSDPLEVRVEVFRESGAGSKKMVELSTLIEDLEWTAVD